MADSRLTARLPLNNYRRQFNDLLLGEINGLGIVSIAPRNGDADALRRRILAAYGTSFPAIGHSQRSQDGAATFLGLQRELTLLLFNYSGDAAVNIVQQRLGDAAYYSDLSDSWTMLRASGPGLERTLQRICMLDLAPSEFPIGSVKRTVMEHIGVILCRESVDSMLLMSPRSFAHSFLQVLETAILDSAE